MSQYNPVSDELIQELKIVLGAENVKTDPDTLDRFKTDEETDLRFMHLPEAVVWAHSTEEVAAVMKLANRFIVPVTPRSAGTSVSDGAIPTFGGIVLNMERMNRILEINEEALYAVVEAGARTIDIQNAAKAKGLLYAGDPCSAESCLIGGNIATNAGGNKAVRYGTTRDQVYAIEVGHTYRRNYDAGSTPEKEDYGLLSGAADHGFGRDVGDYLQGYAEIIAVGSVQGRYCGCL